jgi:colanic acid/amylovoran biosynthesis protein
MVLGMRMHSNIIAATQLKPFVAIAYEHKTRGIAGMLDLSQYCLDYGKFTVDDLFSKLSAAYADRHEVVSKLRSRLEEIRRIELAIWKKALLNQS